MQGFSSTGSVHGHRDRTRYFVWALPVLWLLLLGASTQSARADEVPLESLPGYVDFAKLDGLDEPETSVDVFLRGPLMKLVAAASRGRDPEFAAALEKLDLIRVEIFPYDAKKWNGVVAQSQALLDRLTNDGWDAIANVRRHGMRTHIYMKPDKEKIAGMLVLLVGGDSDEFVFVNIVGDIDPEQIGRLGAGLHISPLANFDSIHRDLQRDNHRNDQ